MGTIAARKAGEICFNANRVLAIELAAAAQAIDLCGAANKLGKGTRAAYDVVRAHISAVEQDRVMYPDWNKAAELIQGRDVVDAVEQAVGELQ